VPDCSFKANMPGRTGLEESIRLGLAKPAETHEDYLATAASAFSLELGEDE
jgi:hypothetical protein